MLTFHEAEWGRGEHIKEAVGGATSGSWQCWLSWRFLGGFLHGHGRKKTSPSLCSLHPPSAHLRLPGGGPHGQLSYLPDIPWVMAKLFKFSSKTCIFWQDGRLIKYFEFWLEAKNGPGWIPLKYFINCVSSEIFFLPSTFLRCCA